MSASRYLELFDDKEWERRPVLPRRHRQPRTRHPRVVSALDATLRITHGALVEVDGTTGSVTVLAG
jgi:hypothetical protein